MISHLAQRLHTDNTSSTHLCLIEAAMRVCANIIHYLLIQQPTFYCSCKCKCTCIWSVFNTSHTSLFFFLVQNDGSDGHQGGVCGPLQRVRRERRLLLGGRQGAARRRSAAAGCRHEADPGTRSQPGARYLGLCFCLPSLRLRPTHTRQRLPLAGQGRLWNVKVMDVFSYSLSFGICKTPLPPHFTVDIASPPAALWFFFILWSFIMIFFS